LGGGKGARKKEEKKTERLGVKKIQKVSVWGSETR